MKYLLLYLTFFLFMNSGSNFTIEVEMIGCECFDREYGRYIYLNQNNQPVDSINFLEYKQMLGTGYHQKRKVAKFKNLKPGTYSISYHNYYGQDSTIEITIGSDKTTEIEICHDQINPQTFEEQTALDQLQNGDTLFINSYKLAGEFGGFDEGLWIWKSKNKIRGAFFNLPSTYEQGWDSRLNFFIKYKISAEFKSEPFELTPEQVADIEHFLIETKYYPQYKWPHTNAPDFLTIYSRTDTLERTNQEWKCNSYLKLREKLSPSNIR